MRAIKYLLSGVLAIVVLLLIWGLVEPYFLDVEQEAATILGLLHAWEGQRIGVIADWQIGMWWDNTPTMRQSVARLIAARPAAVFVLGDFIYVPGEQPDDQIRRGRISRGRCARRLKASASRCSTMKQCL